MPSTTPPLQPRFDDLQDLITVHLDLKTNGTELKVDPIFSDMVDEKDFDVELLLSCIDHHTHQDNVEVESYFIDWVDVFRDYAEGISPEQDDLTKYIQEFE